MKGRGIRIDTFIVGPSTWVKLTSLERDFRTTKYHGDRLGGCCDQSLAEIDPPASLANWYIDGRGNPNHATLEPGYRGVPQAGA